MDEETFKKIVEVSIAQHVSESEKNRDALKKQIEVLQARQLHTSETLGQISHALSDIIERSARVPPESRIQHYEKEIRSIELGINKILSSQQLGIGKLQGAVEILDTQIISYEKMKQDMITEMSRAKEIQELPDLGKAGSARKPGERPHRIKDIRNYSKSDKES